MKKNRYICVLCPVASVTWGVLLLKLLMESELTHVFKISIILAATAFALSGFLPLVMFNSKQ